MGPLAFGQPQQRSSLGDRNTSPFCLKSPKLQKGGAPLKEGRLAYATGSASQAEDLRFLKQAPLAYATASQARDGLDVVLPSRDGNTRDPGECPTLAKPKAWGGALPFLSKAKRNALWP